MNYEPIDDHAERKRISALIDRCEKEQTMMSEDLIKRSDAIDAIELVDWYHQNRNKDMVHGANSDEHQAWYKSQDIYEALENVPSVDGPREWIPCSERPPEEEGEYLVTARKYAFDSSYYDVQIAYFSPNKKWFHISNCEIVAWRPRPQPWEGGNHEETTRDK